MAGRSHAWREQAIGGLCRFHVCKRGEFECEGDAMFCTLLGFKSRLVDRDVVG